MKKFKRITLILMIAVICFVGLLLFNNFQFTSKQIDVPLIVPIEIDKAAIRHFAEAITIKTVSHENPKDFDSLAFYKFNRFLKQNYPFADSLLNKKTFNSFSHLYIWKGTDPSLKPIILMAHLDVVPVIKENLPNWKHPPFGGKIVNDTLWGRGSIDDKNGVIGIMESVELLLKQEFKPLRSIYIAFGHDEEIGGKKGAQAMASYLKEQEVSAKFVLDEGGSIIQGLVPGITKDAAMIGIAEKGFLSLKLSLKIEGGHSSMPEEETAIDVMATAITKIKNNPFPARLSGPMKGFIEHYGPEMPSGIKLVFANSWLFGGLIKKNFGSSGSGNALLRTTIAPTVFNSGVKDNIIPLFANAIVNFRIAPNTSIEEVIAHVKKSINDPRIKITKGDFYSEASKVSSVESFGYKTIERTIAETMPKTLIGPYLVVGATDSRHYKDITEAVYQFSPNKINSGNVKSFHGLNERISVHEFNNGIRFYVQLIKNSSKEIAL